MRRNSWYTNSVSRSSAAASPAPHAFSKPVISGDRAASMAFPEENLSQPWPLSAPVSDCTGGGSDADQVDVGAGDRNGNRGSRFGGQRQLAGTRCRYGMHEPARQRGGFSGAGDHFQDLREGRSAHRVAVATASQMPRWWRNHGNHVRSHSLE